MSNILEYIKWRGDLSFKQDEINEIDIIIFARVSYLPFKSINLEQIDNIENIAEKMKMLSIDKFIWKEDKEFILELGKSNRYKHLNISDYEEILDLEAEKQFVATTIWLPNRYKYISYRGTDMSLVGWKEDFNMSFMKDIPSQKESVKYINKIGKKYKDKLIIGGHSKGGNLSIYSSMFCDDKINKRIVKIINADGPGFDKSVISTENYKKILNRIVTFVPQSSIIGRLLEHEEEYQIVKSSQKGIMQHDIYSWQVNVKELERVENLTNDSKVLNKSVRDWLENTTPQQRENFINIIYDILVTTEAKEFTDFGVDTIKKITLIIKSYRNIDKEEKKEIEEMIKLLLESIIKNIRENKKILEKSKKI